MEVADLGGGRRGVRDSKRVEGGRNVSPIIDLEAGAFSEFVRRVKSF